MNIKKWIIFGLTLTALFIGFFYLPFFFLFGVWLYLLFAIFVSLSLLIELIKLSMTDQDTLSYLGYILINKQKYFLVISIILLFPIIIYVRDISVLNDNYSKVNFHTSSYKIKFQKGNIAEIKDNQNRTGWGSCRIERKSSVWTIGAFGCWIPEGNKEKIKKIKEGLNAKLKNSRILSDEKLSLEMENIINELHSSESPLFIPVGSDDLLELNYESNSQLIFGVTLEDKFDQPIHEGILLLFIDEGLDRLNIPLTTFSLKNGKLELKHIKFNFISVPKPDFYLAKLLSFLGLKSLVSKAYISLK